eukprot:TRINITY_DN26368_c0_g1_i1.p1 TRINITY_DN26368_c0_g1~~TRINITY_DN26368_c0_g1_i1.p1  ORF type:complete len:210 (+),score=36.34 TRINITY_DN26368_c0_g1_i1:62-691(+)
MDALFGKKKTTKEVLRDNKRSLQHNQRDLDRELLQLDRDEKKTMLEIKKLAKQGQNSSAKVLAKEIVRIRGQRDKIYMMKGQLSSVSTRTTTMAANQTIASGMNGATKAMAAANAAMPAQKMQQTMMEYEKQNEMANMKEEMMDDMFESTEEEEEEAEDAMNQVLDSIGLEIGEKMSKVAPSRTALGGASKKPMSAEDKAIADLLGSMP